MRPALAPYSFCLVVAVASAVFGAGCGSSVRSIPDIIFVSSRDGDYAIYAMSADGSHERRLTKEKGDPSSPRGLFFQVEPAWSPDGRRIAFASKRAGSFKIYVMRVDGTGTTRLTSGKDDDTHPTWSSDGKQIAFVRGDQGDLQVMNADGTGVHWLTDDDAEEIDPAWSPDGRWIVYSRRTPGTSVRELWLVRPDGSERHALTKLNATSTSPTWSPGDNRIAFESSLDSGRPGILVIDVDGKGLQRLTVPINEDDIKPAWSPDGETIAFSRDGAITTISGGEEKVLTSARSNDSSPAWNPRPAKQE